MRITRAQHTPKNRRRTKIALAGLAGVASAVAILAGTAQAGGTYNVHLVDGPAHYPHAVDIGVDGQYRGCRIIYPGSFAEFGPSPSGSNVWIHEYPGTQCSYPNAYVPAMRTVHLTGVRPGSYYDLSWYPMNGWG
jgi:hypothetical protein